jgi:hypothetical protein
MEQKTGTTNRGMGRHVVRYQYNRVGDKVYLGGVRTTDPQRGSPLWGPPLSPPPLGAPLGGVGLFSLRARARVGDIAR